MADYFFYDQSNQKQGPFNEQQLKELSAKGIIDPKTQLETKSGYKTKAGQIPGVFQGGTKHEGDSPGIFDIGFTRFITNTWTSILWILCIFFHILACVICVGVALFGGGEAIVLVVVSPIATAISLLFFRMAFEMTIVIFRIESHLRVLREKSEK
jgi:hypothetical protein